MIRRLFRDLLSRHTDTLNQAALILALAAVGSQIMGFVRDRLLASIVGPNGTLDVYYTAFRIPDILFVSIASLVSVVVLVPFLTHLKKDTEDAVSATNKFLSEVFSLFVYTLCGIIILILFLMPKLVPLVAPGFSVSMQGDVVVMSRLLLLSPLLLGLSNIFGAVSQLYKRFVIFSLGPIFYNAGIIFGLLVFYPILGIYGVVGGVLIGAGTHAIIQYLSVRTIGFSPKFTFHFDWSRMRQIVAVSLPRTLGLALSNITITVLLSFATLWDEGAVSLFSFANIIQSVPLSIIGLSYSVAAFPTLALMIQENKKDEFIAHVLHAAKQIIFWSLPVTALFFVLRAHIVRVVFGSSQLSWDQTKIIAAALALFVISAVAQSLVLLFVRALYAAGKTWRPLVGGIVSFIFTVSIAWFLMQYIHTSFISNILAVFIRSTSADIHILALPIAFSIGAFINIIILIAFCHRLFPKTDIISSLFWSFVEHSIAAFVAGAGAYITLVFFGSIGSLSTFWMVLLQGFVAGLAGIVCWVLVLYLIKNKEFTAFSKAVHTKFWTKVVAVPEQSNL